jgi:hypothetical protein
MRGNGLPRKTLFLLFVLLLNYMSPSAHAQYRLIDVNEGFERESFLLPYPFYNESIEFAVGLAGGLVGRPQEQIWTLVSP